MRSEELFARAKAFIPGGVNSPVRAFGSVGMTPRFIASAKGDRIRDVEGNEIGRASCRERVFWIV